MLTTDEIKAKIKALRVPQKVAAVRLDAAQMARDEAAERLEAARKTCAVALSESLRLLGDIAALEAAAKVLGWPEEQRALLLGDSFSETDAPGWAVTRRAARKEAWGHRIWDSAFVAARSLLLGAQ